MIMAESSHFVAKYRAFKDKVKAQNAQKSRRIQKAAMKNEEANEGGLPLAMVSQLDRGGLCYGRFFISRI